MVLDISWAEAAAFVAHWPINPLPEYREATCAGCGQPMKKMWHVFFEEANILREIHLCRVCADPYTRYIPWSKNLDVRQRRTENRIFLDRHKKKPCMDCGVQYPTHVMQFDHVRGKKLFNLGHVSGNKKHNIYLEIEKCDLVCANCHMERTWGRRSKESKNDKTRQKNRDWLSKQKDRPCTDCGKNYPSYVMQFDHVKGSKSFNLGEMGHSIEKKEREIRKCDLVCANCHMHRTHGGLKSRVQA